MKIFQDLKLNEYIKIVRFIKPRLKSYLTGLIVFSITEISFSITIPLAVKYLIDAALKKDMALLTHVVFLLLAISICCGVSFVIFMYLFQTTASRVTAGVRTRVFTHTLHLPVKYFEEHHSGSILSRITNDINAMRNSYEWPLWNALVILAAGISAIVLMLILDWRVSSFLIFSSIAFAVVNSKFGVVIGKISDEIQKTIGKLTEAMGNILSGFWVIKSFNLAPLLQEQFEVHNQELLTQSKARIKKTAWLGCLNFFINWFNFVMTLSVGAILAGKRMVDFGTIIALTHFLWHVNRMVRETGGIIAGFQGYLAGAARVNELYEEPEEPKPSWIIAGEPREGIIEMEGVSFSYDEKRTVLKSLDFKVKEGQTVGFVGPSGGGKSTVLKLLLGFYPPLEGHITICCKGNKCSSLDELRELFAYVPQDPFMFDGTVAENIAYGRPDAIMAEIIQAAKAANAHEFIQNLENGYDTIVGERGVKLSGGQRQRIAIARAFLKNAPILLFDEATSSLDSRSEQLIQSALQELGRNKTVILIAHRLSTIEHADVILVMDDGKVVEKGKHEELLANEGLYKSLYDAQYTLETNGQFT